VRSGGRLRSWATPPGGGGKIGTTKQGIGPCYASKAARNGVRFGQLRNREAFRTALARLIEATRSSYGVSIDERAQLDKWDALRERLLPMVVDGVQLVNDALGDGKRVLAEGANAALLDVDFGTYPYVTSSSTTAGGIATGLGVAPSKLESIVGVVKAYTTRVGGGPFPTELTDARGGGDRPMNSEGSDIGLHLQVKGGEVGVTTGRKRRCGWLDTVVLRYAHALNGFTSLNVTKLDVLDELEELKIGVGYKLNGVALAPGQMPSVLDDLAAVEVVYETHKGWKSSTAGTRKFSDLPKEAQSYVKRIEQLVGVPVAWIGTGVGRNDMVTRGFTFTEE
jgi:adenylosuccinate synthase